METKKFECPMFDLGCPYCTVNGECTIGNPKEECDDYYYYNGEEEEDDRVPKKFLKTP